MVAGAGAGRSIIDLGGMGLRVGDKFGNCLGRGSSGRPRHGACGCPSEASPWVAVSGIIRSWGVPSCVAVFDGAIASMRWSSTGDPGRCSSTQQKGREPPFSAVTIGAKCGASMLHSPRTDQFWYALARRFGCRKGWLGATPATMATITRFQGYEVWPANTCRCPRGLKYA